MGVYFEVSHRIVVYLSCILMVSYRIVMYRHISSVCSLKLSLGDTSLPGIGQAIPVSQVSVFNTSLPGIGIQYQSHRYWIPIPVRLVLNTDTWETGIA